MPRYLTSFDLDMCEQKLDGPEIASPPVNQSSFCAAQGMRAEQPWVQPDTSDPLRHEPGYWRVVMLQPKADFASGPAANDL
jgi:hypothetical protein